MSCKKGEPGYEGYKRYMKEYYKNHSGVMIRLGQWPTYVYPFNGSIKKFVQGKSVREVSYELSKV